jgi:hypothetical protein
VCLLSVSVAGAKPLRGVSVSVVCVCSLRETATRCVSVSVSVSCLRETATRGVSVSVSVSCLRVVSGIAYLILSLTGHTGARS